MDSQIESSSPAVGIEIMGSIAAHLVEYISLPHEWSGWGKYFKLDVTQLSDGITITLRWPDVKRTIHAQLEGDQLSVFTRYCGRKDTDFAKCQLPLVDPRSIDMLEWYIDSRLLGFISGSDYRRYQLCMTPITYGPD